MRERGAFGWLVLILILAAFLRIHQLDQIPTGIYPDEAMNGNNALEALRTGDFKLYYPDNNGREGLFINIQAMFIRHFGVREGWVLRLPSAIFGTLTVWGIYLLGKELFSKRVGLLAAFFAATSVWHIIFSRIGFRAIMAPLLLTWGLYLFHAAVRKGSEEDDGRKYLWIAAIGGVVFGLGFHTYIAYRIMPLLFLLFVPFYFRNRAFWKVTAAFLAGAFLAGLPIGWYYLQNPADFLGRTSQISVFSSEQPLRDLAVNTVKTLGMFNFVGDWNWRHNFAGRPQLFWPVGILFLWGIFVGIRAVFRKGAHLLTMDHEAESFESWESMKNLRLGFLLIFGWFALAFLPVIISAEGLPHALRAILMIPPVFILAGAGALSAWSFFKKHMRQSAVLPIASALFVLLLAYEAYQTYFILWGRNPKTADAFTTDYVRTGRILNQLSRNIPKYVIVEAGGVDVRGLPMPTQTVMFLTDTWSPEEQKAKGIYYVLPQDAGNLPPGPRFYLR